MFIPKVRMPIFPKRATNFEIGAIYKNFYILARIYRLF
ncbi:hypothetical protein LEP1GSC125_2629 [Leptospira mayottensis 200901122]|uniref:Uncharacterized protein n=1 Tax=Leptospira mayottensis 200901122 TaxID=1193010 RepID=A0AA87MQW4_9LEPT|nr:hypothetical protein LEP1GSC125_2629 [Leptospira mayottensis 200901122]